MKKSTIKIALLSVCFIGLSIGVFAQTCTISCYSYSLRRYDVNLYLYEYSPNNQYLNLMHETFFATTDAHWIPSIHAYYYSKNVDLSDMQIPGNLYNATFYIREILFAAWQDQRTVTSSVFNFVYYYTNTIFKSMVFFSPIKYVGCVYNFYFNSLFK